ncbi:PfkB family carbohydrate kinase [Methanosphaera sp.]
MKNKILTIGPVTKDTIITKDNTYNQIGGATYYQSWTFHQLKTSADTIITIGENDLELINKFPDKNKIKIIKKQHTTEYTNIYSENMTRTQKAKLPHNTITPTDIQQTKTNINEYNTVLFSPLSPQDIPLETIAYFKEKNIETIIVAQGYLRSTDNENNIIQHEWKNKENYLKYTDIISLDQEEMKKAFNITNITENTIKKIMKKYTLKTIIITKAEQGSDIYTQKEKIHIPAIKTEKNIDPTGLGDTYIAAYVSKKQETSSIYESGLFASITAKYELENKGPLKISKEIIEKELKEILNNTT